MTKLVPEFEIPIGSLKTEISGVSSSPLGKLGLEVIDIVTETRALRKCPQSFGIDIVIWKNLKAIIQMSWLTH